MSLLVGALGVLPIPRQCAAQRSRRMPIAQLAVVPVRPDTL